MKVTAPLDSRIASLDQFRGYAVAGMFLVNFIGPFAAAHYLFKHHNTYCSYADTIMPQFFFAVGFAYRLALLHRIAKDGRTAAYRHALGRCAALILIGFVIYHLDGGYGSWKQLQELGIWGFLQRSFRSSMFQTLTHIGVTSIWVLPVIAARPRVRIGFMATSGLGHLALVQVFYYEWARSVGAIDGGVLGFLGWTIPTLAGSLAYDLVVTRGSRGALMPLAVWSMGLMLLGYGLSCIGGFHRVLADDAQTFSELGWLASAPFVPPKGPLDSWLMNQQIASLSYMTFAAGFSMAVYCLFVVACDLGPIRIGVFRTFGTNALAGYLIHDVVLVAFLPFTPRDSPLWYVLAAFALYFGITYLFVRSLEKRGIFLRL